jgi:hypothetical protein
MKPHWIVRIAGKLKPEIWDQLFLAASVAVLVGVVSLWFWG